MASASSDATIVNRIRIELGFCRTAESNRNEFDFSRIAQLYCIVKFQQQSRILGASAGHVAIGLGATTFQGG